MRGITWLRATIAGSSLIGLVGSAFLSWHFDKAELFYAAGSAIIWVMIMTYFFEVWTDPKEDTKKINADEIARAVTENVLEHLRKEPAFSAAFREINLDTYKGLERELMTAIRSDLPD